MKRTTESLGLRSAVACGVVALCLGGSVACGGADKPAPPPATPAASAPEPPPPAAPEPTTEAPAADATPAPGATGEADTPTSSEPEDPCSQAAIPYEEKVRPLFNECYREGKKKDPDLAGSIRVTIAVNMNGKVTSAKAAPSELGASVVQCMVKAVKSHPFDGAACQGKTLTVGKTFGSP